MACRSAQGHSGPMTAAAVWRSSFSPRRQAVDARRHHRVHRLGHRGPGVGDRPCSTACHANSSRKNGLPAPCTTSCWRWTAGSCAVPGTAATTAWLSSARRGGNASWVTVACVPQGGLIARDAASGAAAPLSPPAGSTSDVSQAADVGSIQCTSSTTSTSGRCWASCRSRCHSRVKVRACRVSGLSRSRASGATGRSSTWSSKATSSSATPPSRASARRTAAVRTSSGSPAARPQTCWTMSRTGRYGVVWP